MSCVKARRPKLRTSPVTNFVRMSASFVPCAYFAHCDGVAALLSLMYLEIGFAPCLFPSVGTTVERLLHPSALETFAVLLYRQRTVLTLLMKLLLLLVFCFHSEVLFTTICHTTCGAFACCLAFCLLSRRMPSWHLCRSRWDSLALCLYLWSGCVSCIL